MYKFNVSTKQTVAEKKGLEMLFQNSGRHYTLLSSFQLSMGCWFVGTLLNIALLISPYLSNLRAGLTGAFPASS